jgi:hypothetical protein
MTRFINDLGGLWLIITVTVVVESVLAEYIFKVGSYFSGWSFIGMVIMMTAWLLAGIGVFALRDLHTTRLAAVSSPSEL